MGKIRARADNEKLFFDFTYMDQRCREQTTLPDTPANRKKLQKILERIEAEITAVAEAECNTVTGLKQVHHAATPLPLS
ncbi:DUF3596 domain-containing protein [Pseudomonas aeruginosa]|nr:DUF3596 domain-containing protein [Pseudomonas aeruginosa]WGX36110.1 DUF3596 domain-containing protein [Pseudomonas aeruginosa]WGX62011.1 DUF3596 domain-containing protein [Pseudomonas aeruginosa]WLV44737.1 DUF3596 domain-containing protein [Pseudomonas aeruginosa]WLV57157.1 DUF3596 domain-containing protein [Pseudomonas aeruginosa]